MNETGGSDSRDARALDAPVLGFDLARELEHLRGERGYDEFGRSSKTLAKGGNLRLVLTAARSGVRLGEDDAEAPLAVHVLEGRVRVDRDGEALELDAGSVGWLGEGPGWALEAADDAAVLLSVGWPGWNGGEAGR